MPQEIIRSLCASFCYVYHQSFFWHSMGITTIIGMFIGGIIYDGIMSQVKKGIVSLFFYSIIISAITLTRTIPQIDRAVELHVEYQIFSNVATIILVSLFYFLGMFIGVKLINSVYKHNES